MKQKMILISLTALLLIAFAFHYGYPFLTSDSSVYIMSAFNFQVPVDRSPFYGFFVRHSSLHTSLWYTIFCQGIILASLLIQYIRTLFGKDLSFRDYLIVILLVIGGTSVSWTCSYLMPDIFTAILLLSLLLYFNSGPKNHVSKTIYLILIFFSAIIHNSNIVISILFTVALLFAALYKKNKRYAIKAIVMLSVSVFSFLFTCTFNKIYNGDFVLSEGSHVFMMGKLAETGILAQYLEENCDKKNYQLCASRNDIQPSAIGFLWESPNAPHQTLGWVKCKPEYSAIINDVFSQPKYIESFCLKSITSTVRQLAQLQIVKPEAKQSWWVNGAIYTHFRHELNEYKTGAQQTTEMNVSSFDLLYLVLLVISSIAVLFLFGQMPDQRQLALIYGFVIAYIICNAFVTATFANVLDRLNTRVFWLLPATNIIVLCRYWLEKQAVQRRN